MTTKEFAGMFGMTVNEMCEYTGFSRQGLNEIVKGNSTKNGLKKRDAKHNLRDMAVTMRMREQQAADEAYEARIRAIDEVFNTI